MRLALVLALVMSSTAALADAGEPPAAPGSEVGVVVTGEATVQPQVAGQIETWLQKHGHQVVSSPLPPDAINTMIDCFVIEDESCARGVVDKRSKARTIVFARVDVTTGSSRVDNDVTLSVYWFDKTQKGPAHHKEHKCTACNSAAIRAAADDLMSELAGADTANSGRLKATSVPPGATVTVNGKKIGLTPLEHPLAPGSYKVAISRGDHEEARDVVVEAGKTATAEATFPQVGGVGGGGKAARMPAILTMAAGGALLVGGGVLFAIDQDKGPREPPTIRDTAPLGIGLAAAGVAVAIGGFVWFRMTGETSSAPVAAISGDRGYIGWVHRF